MSTRTALLKAIKLVGKQRLADAIGIKYQSMNRWIDQDRMPCTDYNGETAYARAIKRETKGEVTITQLCGFVPPPQSKDWTGFNF